MRRCRVSTPCGDGTSANSEPSSRSNTCSTSDAAASNSSRAEFRVTGSSAAVTSRPKGATAAIILGSARGSERNSIVGLPRRPGSDTSPVIAAIQRSYTRVRTPRGNPRSPDANPVDEHVGRVGAPSRVTTARPGDRQIEDGKQRVTGRVEGPVGQGAGRDVEIGLRPVDVGLPEADAVRIPLGSPGVPGAVHGDGLAGVFSAVQFGVDGGSRSPAAVAVPLHDVDFAAVDGV